MAYNSPQPVNYQNRKDPNLKTARGLRNESYKKKDQQPKPKTSMGGKAEALKIQLEEKKRLRKITNEIKHRSEVQCNQIMSKTSLIFENNECNMM